MKKKIRIALAVFLLIQVVIVNILAQYPKIIETYYSHQIFPAVSLLERYVFGWIPFSVGDLLYFIFIVIFIQWAYKRIKTRFRGIKQWGLQVLSAVSVLYFCFHFFWGMNYYRLPLHKSLQIKATYSHEQLIDFTKRLIHKANTYQLKITGNDSLKVDYPFNTSQTHQLAIKGYASIARVYPKLRYEVESVKPSLYSIPLTYMGFSGYINPFTNEAQINSLIPAIKRPSVTAHEMGHQLGFAKENEANFMACLTLINHPNTYFKYAGYIFALRYCLNEVYRETPQKGKELLKKLHPGVRKNYNDIRAFWLAHKNPLEPLFKVFYGHYLKANNQPKGMQSYNYVVALLVNYYQEKPMQ